MVWQIYCMNVYIYVVIGVNTASWLIITPNLLDREKERDLKIQSLRKVCLYLQYLYLQYRDVCCTTIRSFSLGKRISRSATGVTIYCCCCCCCCCCCYYYPVDKGVHQQVQVPFRIHSKDEQDFFVPGNHKLILQTIVVMYQRLKMLIHQRLHMP